MKEPIKMPNGKHYIELLSYGERHAPGPVVSLAMKHFAGRNPSILEIGVLRGHNAEVMYNALHPSLMVLVDPWDFYGNETHDSNWADVWYRVQNKPEIIVIKGTSEKAWSILDPKLCFDLIYLDGDHLPDGFNLDLKLWSDRVNIGGIYSGHDYNFPNIEESVNKKFGDRVHSSATADRTLGGEEWWVFM
jgi:hypothetical protein